MIGVNHERFALAPMSSGIRALTIGLCILPVALLYMGIRAGHPGALVPGILTVALFVWVWGYFRPTRFELAGDSLTIVWPWRRYRLPLAEVRDVELITGAEFRARYGWGMRVGAGGLWGGFGLLVTRQGTLRFYISRLDGYVLIHPRSGRTLLITPERPEVFADRLRQLIGL